MSKEDEIIVVVKRSDLFDGVFQDELAFQGLSPDDLNQRLMDRLGKSFSSMRRGSTKEVIQEGVENAELNPEYKQPIPYVVITRGDQVFAYERLEAGGESRLHGKISIGVGGHMNPVGLTSFFDVLHVNMIRELREEVTIERGSERAYFDIIGFINDDQDEVGKVHLGVLVKYNIPEGANVTVNETDQLRGLWLTKEELQSPEYYNRLESWSQISLLAL